MAPSPTLLARLDQLIALFNRQSLDLPDGLFDRRTQFVLNGAPFEEMLGRSSADPLVLMIARGPAGYRFAMKALQHAVPDARVERSGSVDAGRGPQAAFTVPLRLTGHLRGSRDPIETVVSVAVVAGEADSVVRADAAVDPAALEPLRAARLRE